MKQRIRELVTSKQFHEELLRFIIFVINRIFRLNLSVEQTLYLIHTFRMYLAGLREKPLQAAAA